MERTSAGIKYVLKTKDNRYYADYQPHDEWSFTDNILEAKLYKQGGLSQAQARVNYAKRVMEYKDIGLRVVGVEEFLTLKEVDIISLYESHV